MPNANYNACIWIMVFSYFVHILVSMHGILNFKLDGEYFSPLDKSYNQKNNP